MQIEFLFLKYYENFVGVS